MGKQFLQKQLSCRNILNILKSYEGNAVCRDTTWQRKSEAESNTEIFIPDKLETYKNTMP